MAQYIGLKVDKVYRCVHNRDLVPHLPFEVLGYKHSPFEVFWNKDFTSYVLCNSSGEDPNCSNKYDP